MSDSSTGKPSFPVLAKNNYNEWAGNCRASLMTHGYWKLVSGKELKPSATEELNKWETKSDKAAGLIYLAVGKELQVLIRPHLDDPVAMWKALEAHHVSKKPGSRFNAYNELFSITKKDDESLRDMATRVETAMQQILDLFWRSPNMGHLQPCMWILLNQNQVIDSRYESHTPHQK